MSPVADLIAVSAPAGVDEVRALLRTLAERGSAVRAQAPDAVVRTWAILGELVVEGDPPENERVVEHDRLGRQAVRLAVDKTLCVGDSRAVRALHQGAVMEGSWGDEVRMVATVADARELLTSTPDWSPAATDVVLIAGSDPALAALADVWGGDR
ncbi:UDP-N-acetylmuramoyl-tripeptide--D-alanyl-D-alanine ligase [Gordonia sp. NPDC003424]